MGDIEESIAKQAIQNGMPIPDRIQNAPGLIPGLEIFLGAFFELDSERTHSNGVTMIPASKIHDWADRYRLSDEMREDMIHHIRWMDSDHCRRVAEKQKQAAEAARTKG
jgi:hypothetical protein